MRANIRIINNQLIPHTPEDAEKIAKLNSKAIYMLEFKEQDTRTLAQNKALWLWSSMIAKELNSNELYMRGIFNNEIEWTKDLVHTQIVKGTLKQLFDIGTSTKLKKDQLERLIDYVALALAHKGIVAPDFPSREE
jgi:hypothetical protein